MAWLFRLPLRKSNSSFSAGCLSGVNSRIGSTNSTLILGSLCGELPPREPCVSTRGAAAHHSFSARAASSGAGDRVHYFLALAREPIDPVDLFLLADLPGTEVRASHLFIAVWRRPNEDPPGKDSEAN